MNKAKLLAIAIGILILSQALGIVYFADRAKKLSHKSAEISAQLKDIQPSYEQLSQQQEQLQEKYNALTKEHEAVKIDRNNLLAQVKRLLGDRARAEDLQEGMDKASIDMQARVKEIEEIKKFNIGLRDEINRLEVIQARLIEERDSFKEAYEKSKRDTQISELRGEISRLNRENKGLERELSRRQRDLNRLSEASSRQEAEIEKLNGQLSEYKKNYAEAVNKNRRLEREIRDLPRNFAEIARQNKRLIQQTAKTHYNLGVFYTKNKEYRQAIAEFEKAIELAPDEAYAHFNLGYIYAEYLVDRKKAIEHFKHFLQLAKSGDKDVDWVKQYLLTWETYEGKRPLH